MSLRARRTPAPRVLRGLREILDHYDALRLGEMPWTRSKAGVISSVAADCKELDMGFQFGMEVPEGGQRGPGANARPCEQRREQPTNR
jgi:hypothetical protein